MVVNGAASIDCGLMVVWVCSHVVAVVEFYLRYNSPRAFYAGVKADSEKCIAT